MEAKKVTTKVVEYMDMGELSHGLVSDIKGMIEQVRSNLPSEPVAIDNHTGETIKIHGIGILENANLVVIPDTSAAYGLNIAEFIPDDEDGVVWHLTRDSEGGTVHPVGGETVGEDIKAYNDEMTTAISDGQTWLKGYRVVAVIYMTPEAENKRIECIRLLPY